MCVCVCAYVCICVCVYVCMCVSVYVCMCVCVYVCLCVCVYVCTCVCVHVCMCVCVYVCMCVYTHTHTQPHADILTHKLYPRPAKEIYRLCACESVRVCVCEREWVCVWVCVCVCVCAYVSVSVCVCVCMSYLGTLIRLVTRIRNRKLNENNIQIAPPTIVRLSFFFFRWCFLSQAVGTKRVLQKRRIPPQKLLGGEFSTPVPVFCLLCMGWLRLVGSLKLQVSFTEYSLFYRALLQKSPFILRSLLIVSTLYHQPNAQMNLYQNRPGGLSGVIPSDFDTRSVPKTWLCGIRRELSYHFVLRIFSARNDQPNMF